MRRDMLISIVTERARKLRAQYALQAQSLKTRVELRINRIPTALRKLTMGELLAKYSEVAPKKPALKTAVVPKKTIIRKDQPKPNVEVLAPPPKPRGVKRKRYLFTCLSQTRC
jgi:hypothetical protein